MEEEKNSEKSLAFVMYYLCVGAFVSWLFTLFYEGGFHGTFKEHKDMSIIGALIADFQDETRRWLFLKLPIIGVITWLRFAIHRAFILIGEPTLFASFCCLALPAYLFYSANNTLYEHSISYDERAKVLAFAVDGILGTYLIVRHMVRQYRALEDQSVVPKIRIPTPNMDSLKELVERTK